VAATFHRIGKSLKSGQGCKDSPGSNNVYMNGDVNSIKLPDSYKQFSLGAR
jgi:hypothetical protein